MKKLLVCALCLAAQAWAGDAPFNQHWLESRAAHWQAILQLQDWRIAIRAVRLVDILPGAVADSYWNSKGMAGEIHVLDPRDYPEARAKYPILRGETPRQIRLETDDSILHELLHLRLTALSHAPQGRIEDEEEIAVVRLTTALLRGGRQW